MAVTYFFADLCGNLQLDCCRMTVVAHAIEKAPFEFASATRNRCFSTWDDGPEPIRPTYRFTLFEEARSFA